MLQTGRLRVRFPMVSLEFFSDIILPVALGLISTPVHCPVSNPVIILSWFLLRLSGSPAFFFFFYRGVFKEAVSLPLSTYGLPMLLKFSALQFQTTALTTFADMPSAGSGHNAPQVFCSSVPDHCTGSLCSYTKCRLRSYEWM